MAEIPSMALCLAWTYIGIYLVFNVEWPKFPQWHFPRHELILVFNWYLTQNGRNSLNGTFLGMDLNWYLT